MPIYAKLLNEAETEYAHQPVRATKIRGIRREAKARFAANVAFEDIPTPAQLQAQISALKPVRVLAFMIITDIHLHGRLRCKEMINRSLPYAVAYVPELDLEWPY